MFLLAGHFKELSQYLTHHWLVLLLGLLSALFGFLCPQCWSSLIKNTCPLEEETQWMLISIS